MNTFDAHDLLDAARDGAEFTEEQINEALRTTGDLAGIYPREEDEHPVVHLLVPAGKWERKATGLARAQWFEVVA